MTLSLSYSIVEMANEDRKFLSEKSALITGGSRGIGRAIAFAYAHAGARVFICGRNQQELNRAVREIHEAGGVAAGVDGDVGNAADVTRIVSSAVERYGTIDVLVNNASILGPRGSIANYPQRDWDEVLRINLTGVFLLTQAVLKIMSARQSGSIINVSSGVGRIGKAHWGAYAVSKFGLEGLTQVLADELKETAIRVNSVNPGATRTSMRAQAYPEEDPLTLPTPDEITAIFLYLASDDGAEITGRSWDARQWRKPKN